jgi:hypothetical protein
LIHVILFLYRKQTGLNAPVDPEADMYFLEGDWEPEVNDEDEQ